MPDAPWLTNSADAPSKLHDLSFAGLISSLVLWTVILTALFSSNRLVSDYVFLAIMLLLAVIGLAEFYGHGKEARSGLLQGWGIFGGVLLMVGTFFNLTGHVGTSGSARPRQRFRNRFLNPLRAWILPRGSFFRNNTAGILAISTTPVRPHVCALAAELHSENQLLPARGTALLSALFHAYHQVQRYRRLCRGSLIGKAQNDPAHQPRKNLGRLRRARLSFPRCAVWSSFIFLAKNSRGMNVMHAVILGIVLERAAVVGDLIESLFKREAGVKDSGQLFPGIGGILDLLDSLCLMRRSCICILRHVLTKPSG